MYRADHTTSAMHGKQFFLDSLRAGHSESSLYLRVEFAGAHPPDAEELREGYQIVATSEALAPASTTAKPAVAASVEVAGGRIQRWQVTRDSAVIADSGQAEATDAGVQPRFRLRDAMEIQLPLVMLGAAIGGKLHLRVSLWRSGLPVDSLPAQGFIELDLRPERDLLAEAF